MSYKPIVGRPLKFRTVEELQTKIDEYFAYCDPHPELVDEINSKGEVIKVKQISEQKPYTITGLARFIGSSRELLLDYQDKPEFSDAIKNAKLKVQEFSESSLFTGKPVGAIFTLKNNHGYVDKVEVSVNHSLSLRDTIKALELEENSMPVIEGQIINSTPSTEDDDED